MPLPTNLAEAHALILRQREELAAAAARASGAEAMIAHLKLVIAKLRREQYGQSSERGRKVLDQLELQLEELEAETSETAVAAEEKAAGAAVKSFARRPVRAPLPAHLPRERVVIPAPCACPACGGRLAKLGEDITETLEIVPRQWKVIQTVREKFTPTQGNPRRDRQRLCRTQCAGSHCAPIAFIQQSADLTGVAGKGTRSAFKIPYI